MSTSNEEHLFRLHSYLQTNLSHRPGINVIKAGVMSHCRKEFLVDKVDEKTMCPNCFCYWSEGNFSLSFNSKKSRNKKEVKTNIWKIKCLNCLKYLSYIHRQPFIKPSHGAAKKSEGVSHQTFQSQKKEKSVKNLPQPQKRQNKQKSLPQSKKRKREEKNLPPKKKSNLTFFNDFL